MHSDMGLRYMNDFVLAKKATIERVSRIILSFGSRLFRSPQSSPESPRLRRLSFLYRAPR